MKRQSLTKGSVLIGEDFDVLAAVRHPQRGDARLPRPVISVQK